MTEISSVQNDTIIHRCIRSKMDGLESNLLILLECYPETVFSFDEHGFLPIHLACIYYPTNQSIIKVLVKAYKQSIYCKVHKCPRSVGSKKQRVPIGIENKFNRAYPLHIAIANHASLDVLRILSDNDIALLRYQDKNGRTALSIAIQFQVQPSIINWLIAADCALNKISDFSMNLPIHIACMYGCNEDIVETLLLSDISNITLKNRHGQTPLEIASRSSKCSDEVIDILRKYERKDFKILDVAECVSNFNF